jgi:hypothetical protein
MGKKLRDEVRRLTVENAALSGELLTTDYDVESVETLRADRVVARYQGGALRRQDVVRCADCGERGERTGHMGCQYPGRSER